ncbi:MAG: hypothetical protein R3264_03460 [Anaerolineae bacterium]|nr:hypothetical protein [Anaerolineae bacterium]
MDELVKMVSERTGLSEEMSQKAVETVLEYLKDRLPAPIAAQLDNFLAADGGESGGLGGMVGGLFGG